MTGYREWLGRQPLAPRSREAYLSQVKAFLTWLTAPNTAGGQEPIARCPSGPAAMASGCSDLNVEGAKYWHRMLTEIRIRGAKEVSIVGCDRLGGLAWRCELEVASPPQPSGVV